MSPLWIQHSVSRVTARVRTARVPATHWTRSRSSAAAKAARRAAAPSRYRRWSSAVVCRSRSKATNRPAPSSTLAAEAQASATSVR